MIFKENKAAVVNVGLDLFRKAMEERGVEVVTLDWRPPAGDDRKTCGTVVDDGLGAAARAAAARLRAKDVH